MLWYFQKVLQHVQTLLRQHRERHVEPLPLERRTIASTLSLFHVTEAFDIRYIRKALREDLQSTKSKHSRTQAGTTHALHSRRSSYHLLRHILR